MVRLVEDADDVNEVRAREAQNAYDSAVQVSIGAA